MRLDRRVQVDRRVEGAVSAEDGLNQLAAAIDGELSNEAEARAVREPDRPAGSELTGRGDREEGLRGRPDLALPVTSTRRDT